MSRKRWLLVALEVAVILIIWVVWSASGATVAVAPKKLYLARAVGNLPGKTVSQPWGFNDHRRVVGISSIQDFPLNETLAFTWTASGGIQSLGTAGGGYSFAYWINNNGNITGFSQLANGLELAFYQASATGRMKGLRYLPSPNPYSRGYGINSSKHIAGFCNNEYSNFKAVIWWNPASSNPPQNLGNLTGDPLQNSIAYAINDNDLVVGMSGGANGKDRPIYWTQASGMVDLGTLGGDSGLARAVTNSGVAVGGADNLDGLREAFIVDLNATTKTLVGLGGLGGTGSFNNLPTVSYAQSINESFQVVGVAFNSAGEQRSFLWTQADGMRDLTPLVSGLPAGAVLIRATKINNGGDIVGWTADFQAFLLLRKQLPE